MTTEKAKGSLTRIAVLDGANGVPEGLETPVVGPQGCAVTPAAVDRLERRDGGDQDPSLDVASQAPGESVGRGTLQPQPEIDGTPPLPQPTRSYTDLYRRHERLVTLVARGAINSLYLTGSPGCGKTSRTLAILKVHGLVEGQDYVHLKGVASPMAFYRYLYEHRSKIVLADDVDSILTSAANILKAVLSEGGDAPRTVSYISSRLDPSLPAQFDFIGALVILSNADIAQSANPHLNAISSRTFYLSIHLTRSQMLEYIEHEVMPKPFGGTSMADRRFCFHHLVSASARSKQTVDVRRYLQLLTLFQAEKEEADFLLHVSQMFTQDEELLQLKRALDSTFTITEASALWMAATGKSRAAFFRQKKANAKYL